MKHKVLIVEDEIFAALDLQNTIEDLGHEVVGLAADGGAAYHLAELAEVAFVDLYLRDGLTGPEIGRRLAGEFGLKVIYLTANPDLVQAGVAGTIGVLSKPHSDRTLEETLTFIGLPAAERSLADAPRGLKLFV
eukprot:TRINITY_DN21302_c0_g1_i1.p2 TRINITY_DN21302_c0_g1~~TRINITY_DN21302_c0_g1_i1.p2  ORF type:complete len:134 (-),score=12.72 TRINITY_DN21302_c0_g1_i1:826-1227(-)